MMLDFLTAFVIHKEIGNKLPTHSAQQVLGFASWPAASSLASKDTRHSKVLQVQAEEAEREIVPFRLPTAEEQHSHESVTAGIAPPANTANPRPVAPADPPAAASISIGGASADANVQSASEVSGPCGSPTIAQHQASPGSVCESLCILAWAARLASRVCALCMQICPWCGCVCCVGKQIKSGNHDINQ